MHPIAIALTVAAVCCWTTWLWYPLYRRIRLKLGYDRMKSGRPKFMTPIEWLNATGCGGFLGTMLWVLSRACR